MQLYIVRHGIAIDREDPKCPSEAERYLTEEGVEKTKQVAKGIAALGLEADLMISSPYARAACNANRRHFRQRSGVPKAKNTANGQSASRRRARRILARARAREERLLGVLLWPRAARGRFACRRRRRAASHHFHEEGRGGSCGAKAAVAA